MPLVNPVNRSASCEGRLTLASGTPVTISDQTAKTTVYFTPYLGNRIALFNGVNWDTHAFAEVSVAVPSTLFRLFDIFIYNNGGTITLEAVSWSQTTGTITAATAAAECQITSTSHGRSDGDLVGIAGITGTLGTNTANGVNGKVWACRTIAANTFTLDGSDTSGLTYTSGGTWYYIPNSRSTNITLQNGVYVQSGATNKRYLGTCMTTGVSGECEDSVSNRLVWNYYNRVPRQFYKVESAGSWTYSTSTVRAMNNNTATRVSLIVGAAEGYFIGGIAAKFSTTGSAANGEVLLADNNVDNFISAANPANAVANAGDYASWTAHYVYPITLGYHFLQAVERGFGVGTQTYYGESSSGIFGKVFG